MISPFQVSSRTISTEARLRLRHFSTIATQNIVWADKNVPLGVERELWGQSVKNRRGDKTERREASGGAKERCSLPSGAEALKFLEPVLHEDHFGHGRGLPLFELYHQEFLAIGSSRPRHFALVSLITTGRPGLGRFGGRNRNAVTTLNIVASRPLPRASVATATAVKPGLLTSIRTANRTSCKIVRCYSYLNATIGSTLAARRAGM